MEEKAIDQSAGIFKEVQKKLKNKELKNLKLIDLKEISKEIGLKGISNLRKSSLINLINNTLSTSLNSPRKARKKGSKEKKITSKKNLQTKSSSKKISKKTDISKKASENNKTDKKEINEDFYSKYKRLSIDKINSKIEEIVESLDWKQKNREIQALIKIFKEKLNKESTKAEKKFFNNNSSDKTFIYRPEYKIKFDKIIFEYRSKRKKYFKDLDNTQNKNFEKKLEIIENIKKIIDKNTDDFELKYKEFKKNKENWHLTGPVPRSKDQNLWQTFKHHVERFYDLLHLNRKFRRIDFKNNYKEKLKIIENAELLLKEKDIIKATRTINILHKKWKNELGPVEKKHRESLWKRFQLATKEIQIKRKKFHKNATKSIKENITSREEILKKLKSFSEKLPDNHLSWQENIGEFNKLREDFKNVGYIPNKVGKLLWENFRDYSKSFMVSKNQFYKNQKQDYNLKILQKKDLINELNSYLESDNWDEKLEIVKQNQVKWKKIGFIPRRIDNKLWKKFSNLNSIYFDRIRSGYDNLNKKEVEFYNSKKDFIDKLNKIKIPKDISKATVKIEKEIINWNKLGQLNKKINNKLNSQFSKSLINIIRSNKSLTEIKENLIFEVKIKLMEFDIDQSKKLFESELKKENNLVNELNQLENNLDFFTNSSSENPLFKDVEKKITEIKNEIELIKENKKRMKILIKKDQNNPKSILNEEEKKD
tara:strand:- start:1178 stop:3307 length:2130 start_codon:yes stop_codon:yes gene_type:complete